tara:strand:+ start:144 stop:332 length:189 start_codon:yes stop_codon:yes gene_type:complete
MKNKMSMGKEPKVIGIIANALIFGRNTNINSWMMPVKKPNIKHLASVGFVLNILEVLPLMVV